MDIKANRHAVLMHMGEWYLTLAWGYIWLLRFTGDIEYDKWVVQWRQYGKWRFELSHKKLPGYVLD